MPTLADPLGEAEALVIAAAGAVDHQEWRALAGDRVFQLSLTGLDDPADPGHPPLGGLDRLPIGAGDDPAPSKAVPASTRPIAFRLEIFDRRTLSPYSNIMFRTGNRPSKVTWMGSPDKGEPSPAGL